MSKSTSAHHSYRSPSHELLTKSDIMKQYRVPKDMLDKAIIDGELRSIDGPIKFHHYTSDDFKRHWKVPEMRSRYYIPRHTVEKWIDRKVKA